MRCQFPRCQRKNAKYFICWDEGVFGKGCGLVCGTHDKAIGRKNLMKGGMTLQDAIEWEADNKVDSLKSA